MAAMEWDCKGLPSPAGQRGIKGVTWGTVPPTNPKLMRPNFRFVSWIQPVDATH
jgi:hypothetical protein